VTAPAAAPEAVRGWIDADTAADPAAARRPLLAPEVVFEFPPTPSVGPDAVLAQSSMVMPPGWLGDDVEWALPEPGADPVVLRATGPGGGPVHVRVPGLPVPPEPMAAMDLLFSLDGTGRIARITGRAHHVHPQGTARALRPGDPAPGFVLPDVHGTPVPLRSGTSAGPATVVIFTCNHCPYSLGWHDRLQQVARDHADRGVRFLQINANDPAAGTVLDGVERSRERVAAGEFAGPYLVDADQSVARSWGARYTPEVFVLDAAGTVAYHGAPDADVGEPDLAADLLRDALAAVLDGRAPDRPETDVLGCSIKWSS